MPQQKRKRVSTNTVDESDAEGDRDGDYMAEDSFIGDNITSETGAPQAECPFQVVYRQTKKPPKGVKGLPKGMQKGIQKGMQKGMPKGLPKGKKAKMHQIEPTTHSVPPPVQQLDQELPEDTTVYTVKPKPDWDNLKKYRNFVGTFSVAIYHTQSLLSYETRTVTSISPSTCVFACFCIGPKKKKKKKKNPNLTIANSFL